jgi:signal transduction histidine kinase
MTLNRLKTIAVVMPLAGVIVLEITRFYVIGLVSWEKRLALDLVLVAAIVVFTAVMFKFIDEMHDRLMRQNDELRALHTAGLDISGELSLDVVLRKVVERARTLVGARYGALSVVDVDQRISSFVTAGISQEQRDAIGAPPVGHGLLGIVLREGQHLRLDDLGRHPASYGFPPNHPPMRSLLAVPIPCKGPFLGNLYLTEKENASRFTEEDEETLVRFAVQAGLAIDNAYLHEQVADLAVAQERLRIAHEMHDGLAQILGYVNTKVQAAEAYMKRDKPEEATVQLRELASAARQAYSDVRESIVGLRTLPDPQHTLSSAIQEYLERWQEMSGVAATLNMDPSTALRPSHELQLVRIVQEALTNVRKHARATHAHVDIHKNGSWLRAIVRDDGAGFNAHAPERHDFPQFGLSTMRERAQSIGATLEIESVPGVGTTVRFELPLASEGA